MTIWYSADAHFFHDNIRRLCNRPFNTVEEMDAAMTERWNKTVGNSDSVYFLGDFSWAKGDQAAILFRRLEWNQASDHRQSRRSRDACSAVGICTTLSYIVLFHYGLRTWNRMFRGSMSFYGHSHGKLPGNSKSLDVGVDCWNFTPVNLSQIMARMATLPGSCS